MIVMLVEQLREQKIEIERLRAALHNIIAGHAGECGCIETARHALGKHSAEFSSYVNELVNEVERLRAALKDLATILEARSRSCPPRSGAEAMTDIVERLLRTLVDKDNCPRMDSERWLPVGLAREAANEIGRLRAALQGCLNVMQGAWGALGDKPEEVRIAKELLRKAPPRSQADREPKRGQWD